MKKTLPKSAKEKLKLIKKALRHGVSVSKACRRVEISRMTYYRWSASSHPRKLKSTRRKEQVLLKRKLLRLVVAHPHLSCAQLAEKLGQSESFTWQILNQDSLGTRKLRRRWARKIGRYPSRTQKYEQEFGIRVMLLERGQKIGISRACRENGVSRTLFYKWKKRQLAGEPLENKAWRVARWGRQVAPEKEEVVLSLVIKHPEFSVHKLFNAVPSLMGAPLVGHHGIQNILRRNNLNTYERRLLYSQSRVPTPAVRPAVSLLGRIKSVWQTFVPQVAPAPPPVFKERFLAFLRPFVLSLFSTTIFSILFVFWISMLASHPGGLRVGLFFASISLLVGTLFFLYSMKYYFTLALVLSFSTQTGGPPSPQATEGKGWLARIFGVANGSLRGLTSLKSSTEVRPPPGGGLQPNLDHIKLKRYPFISIHLPFYNEKNVVNRILAACTSFDYPNYEVIVCDDSTDETVQILKDWEKHPRIKILHRPTREGFKGGALREALKHMDPKTEFVIVFDADFVPYPDTLEQFVKYFKATGGWEESKDYQAAKIQTIPYETFSKTETSTDLVELLEKQVIDLRQKSQTACVAGYQWHVLNKSENWITRGVRTEYAGSYVIERPGQEILGALKIIHGSVYCIRADVLKHFGWGTSITEDFELTLRIYEKGFKVAYTPYIQAPSECVSTIKRLIRQRMRWSEGHSFNVKKMFGRLITSPRLTLTEKLEFLYISPYYLQAFFFLVGTFSWLISETVFAARLPFWTSLWGWSLVLTNFFVLPLMNAVGLFLEESEEKDYLGLLSFIVLSYLLVPFQAYASVKGFLEKQEGPWFRTPKTGLITDIFTRGRFYRWISGILPGRAPTPAVAQAGVSNNSYLSLATANNRFQNFKIRRRIIRWVGNLVLVASLLSTLLLTSLAPFIPQATSYASQPAIRTIEDIKSGKVKNQSEEKEINTPVVVNRDYQGKPLEFIFHQEPRVRIKYDGREMEIKTTEIEGLGKVNPKKSVISGSKVTYYEVVSGMDLVYEVAGQSLVEKFVVRKPLSIKGVVQSLQLKEIKVVQSEAKNFGFFTKENQPIFNFEPPSMWEEQKPQEENFGLEYRLEKAVVGYTLKKNLTTDGQNWLKDPKRSYPVIIDPSVLFAGVADVPGANLSGATAPWNWQSVNPDYTVKFKNDVTAGQIGEFSRQGKTLTFQPMALNWTNDLSQIEQIAIPSSGATANPSGNVMRWNNAYGANRHLEFEARVPRLVKNFIINSFVDLPVPPQTIIDGGNPRLEVNFIFDWSPQIDVIVNGSVWDKKTDTNTFEKIEFRDSQTGQVYWLFEKPLYQGNDGDNGVGTTRLKKQGGSFYVSIHVPYSWLQTATYPVTIDPSVVVSGTMTEDEAQNGGMQRKLVYASGNWYAFYEDGADVFYKKSSDGSTWGGAVDIDSSDADNFRPSVWLEGTTIYVAWVDNSSDSLEVNTINTASSDALGTKCTAPASTFYLSGSVSTGTFSIAVADDGTVYLASADAVYGGYVFKLTFSTCTFTDITSGSGLTLGDNPTLTTIGNNLHVVFQDGQLSHSVYNGTSWTSSGDDLSENEAQNGGMQRKLVYASGNWYAFYENASDVWYKKSSDGSTWGGAVDIDSSDADNFRPSVWLEGTTIYVAWVDNSNNSLEVNTINTASSDALGTKCTASANTFYLTGSASAGTFSIAVADDGTVYLASADAVYGGYVFKLTFSTCTFTDITSGSGLTLGDNPTLTTIGNNLHVVFQDGQLSHSVYNGSSWTTSNATIDTDTDSVYSLTTDGTNLWLLTQDDTTSTAFYKYNGSSWSSQTAPWTGQTNLTSVSLTYDSTNSDLYAFAIKDTSEQAYFISTDATTISWGTQTSFGFTAGDLGHISSPQEGAGTGQIGVTLRDRVAYLFGSLTPSTSTILGPIDYDTDSVYSLTTDGTNLWLLTVDDTASTAFYKCASCTNNANWSSQTAPWTGQTNLTSATISYDSTNSDLYAMVIKDTSEQAYFISTDATTISWGSETSFGFTAGDLGHISSPQEGAGTGQIGVVLRQGANLEFAVVPENLWLLLGLIPFLPAALRKLREGKRMDPDLSSLGKT